MGIVTLTRGSWYFPNVPVSSHMDNDHLSLAYQKLEPTQLSTLRKQVPLLPQLTSLDLTQTGLTDEDVVSIVDFFNPKCGLKEIYCYG